VELLTAECPRTLASLQLARYRAGTFIMAKDVGNSGDSEQQRVESSADWYFTEQLPIDYKVRSLVYEDLRFYLRGPEGLELGSGNGEMTKFLVQDFARLTIVDASAQLLSSIPDAPNLVKVQALFEEFKPDHPFNSILMSLILEHVEQPVALLKRAKNWLAPDGKILINVPNAHSIHRLAATYMGLLKDPYELNPRDHAVGHRRIYTPETLRKDVKDAGLRIAKMGGTFFKPLSYQQIQEQWTSAMVEGFYKLGKDFPENAAEIYAVCELP
jgi:trans-aconitate methyltransferase